MSALRIQMLSIALATGAYAQTPELVDVLNWKGTIGGGRMTAVDIREQIPGVMIELTDTWDTLSYEFLYRHVAHELGHSVNVDHHGSGDFKPVWSIVGSALDGGVLYETRGDPPNQLTKQITVRNENDDDRTEAMVFFISQDPPRMAVDEKSGSVRSVASTPDTKTASCGM